MEKTAKAAAQIEWGTEGEKERETKEREVAENAAKFAVKKHLIVVVVAAAVYALLSALNL